MSILFALILSLCGRLASTYKRAVKSSCWLLVGALIAVCGCSHAAHVRNGVGCVDTQFRVVLDVPAVEGTDDAQWTIQLSAPLEPGEAIRIVRSARSAEYREGSPRPTFVSQHIDGTLKRLNDDESGAQRYAIQAIAKQPTIDAHDVGSRGIAGEFSVRRAPSCGL